MFLVDERGIWRRVEGRARDCCCANRIRRTKEDLEIASAPGGTKTGYPSTTVETQQLPSCVAHLRLGGGMGDLLAPVSFLGLVQRIGMIQVCTTDSSVAFESTPTLSSRVFIFSWFLLRLRLINQKH